MTALRDGTFKEVKWNKVRSVEPSSDRKGILEEEEETPETLFVHTHRRKAM